MKISTIILSIIFAIPNQQPRDHSAVTIGKAAEAVVRPHLTAIDCSMGATVCFMKAWPVLDWNDVLAP